MALGDRQHVEAVAIMRSLIAPDPGERAAAEVAAEVWLRENHPEPAVYMAAVRESVVTPAKPESEPVCQCWNEGQYGRVHREDCPLHSD